MAEQKPYLDRDGEYCPLCGAHPFEQFEGEASDSEVVRWEEQIKALMIRLQQLTGEVSRG